VIGIDACCILKSDSTFEEMHWSDYMRRPRILKGKWRINQNEVVLKTMYSTHRLKIHQYEWATFLIPAPKEARFAYEFNRNIHVIDSLKPYVEITPSKYFDRDLREFRTLCFIKRIVY